MIPESCLRMYVETALRVKVVDETSKTRGFIVQLVHDIPIANSPSVVLLKIVDTN